MSDENILDSIETVFNVEYDNCHDAEIVFNSIRPEISFARGDRSTSEILLEDNVIVIKIFSNDVVSLRASINSYVRWIKLSNEILNLI